MKSLQVRITLIAVMFAVLLAAALAAVGGLVVHQQLVAGMSARAHLAAMDLQGQLDRLFQLGLPADEVAGFDEQCASLLRRDPNLEFAGVFDVFGRRLFAAGELKEAWTQDIREISHAADLGVDDGLVAVQSVRSKEGRVSAYVVVAVSEDIIHQASWGNLRYFVAIALVLILVGLALHHAVLRRLVTRPLRGLISAIERIDPDDPYPPIALPTAGEDDIGRLARAFGDLLRRLGDARRALVAQNRKLEATVRERTRQLEEANGALAADIERRKQLEQELRELASTDSLTGLANRAFLMPYLERRLELLRRDEGMLAILLFDLDGFKPVNDRFGHSAGDLALQMVAQRVLASNRQSDLVARIGGDEFVVVVEGFTELQQVEASGMRLVALFQEFFEVGECRVRMGVSVGAAVFPLDATDPSGLLAQADRAMYRAKAAGGGFSFVGDKPGGSSPGSPPGPIRSPS